MGDQFRVHAMADNPEDDMTIQCHDVNDLAKYTAELIQLGYVRVVAEQNGGRRRKAVE